MFRALGDDKECFYGGGGDGYATVRGRCIPPLIGCVDAFIGIAETNPTVASKRGLKRVAHHLGVGSLVFDFSCV